MTRQIVVDFAALLFFAAAVGLGTSVVLGGATLLFSRGAAIEPQIVAPAGGGGMARESGRLAAPRLSSAMDAAGRPARDPTGGQAEPE